jgi:CRISPR-associated exonuclease Cas4
MGGWMMRLELWIILFAALVILSAVFWLISRARMKQTGLPDGRVRYSDTGAWRKVEKPYFDGEWGLVGKPDYVIESKGTLIPVEVKSTSAESPYESHVMQLAAYCRLLQVTGGHRPVRGLIKYRNRVFEIEYTAELERKLKSLVNEVRSLDPTSDVPRSHHSASRCRSCGYAENCDQRLDQVG